MTNLDTGGRGLDRRPYRVDRRTTVGLALQRTPGAYFSGGNFWNADFRGATLRDGLLKNRYYEALTFPMPIYTARPSTAALWTNGTTCATGSIDACRV